MWRRWQRDCLPRAAVLSSLQVAPFLCAASSEEIPPRTGRASICRAEHRHHHHHHQHHSLVGSSVGQGPVFLGPFFGATCRVSRPRHPAFFPPRLLCAALSAAALRLPPPRCSLAAPRCTPRRRLVVPVRGLALPRRCPGLSHGWGTGLAPPPQAATAGRPRPPRRGSCEAPACTASRRRDGR